MEILKDKDISELRLGNDEKLKITFQDKYFFLQAKKDDILIDGVSLQMVLDCIIQAKVFSKSQSKKKKPKNLLIAIFQCINKFRVIIFLCRIYLLTSQVKRNIFWLIE